MQSVDSVLKRIESESRMKRKKHVRRLQMLLIGICVMIPTCLCILAFYKMAQLNRKLDNIIVALDENQFNFRSDANLQLETVDQNAGVEDRKQTVYLTFDDGPSKNTEAILKILKDENVKATFFVTGKKEKNDDKLYKQIVDDGHSIGMHTFSHVYEEIYRSVDDFAKDVYQIQSCIYNTTGVVSTIYRFPGGSSNQVSQKDMTDYIKYLNENSYVYFDWNVSSGDAGGTQSEKTIYQNIMNGIGNKKVSVVLMHDADEKTASVKALLRVIKDLKKKKVHFAALYDDTSPVQHISAETVE